MKVRKGFVSNSSSSSFVLAVRRGHRVMELLDGVHPLVRTFAKPAIEFLSRQNLLPVNETLENFFHYSDEEEYVRERTAEILALIDGENPEDWLLVCGEASDFDRDDTGEMTICYLQVEHDEGPVRLWSQGGY